MAKSLTVNTIYLVVYKFMNVLFPLITVSYASHIIMADGIGRVSSAQNIVQYFVIIAGLGIPSYGIREIAKARSHSNEQNAIFSELVIINTVSTFICLLAYYIIVHHLQIAINDQLLYTLLGLTIFFNFFNVDWFYQGQEDFAYIAKRSLLIKICSLVLLFLLVKERNDYIWYALINLFGIAGNNLLNCINLRKYRIKLTLLDINVSRHVSPILLLLSTTIAIELYTMVDTTMLTFLCPSEKVAYYSNAIKIVRLLVIFITSIGGVLLPRLSYYKSVDQLLECEKLVNRVFSFLFVLIIPCFIALFLLSDTIVPILFGPSFCDGIITMKMSSFLVLALGFSNLFGTQVLLTFKQEKKLLYTTIIGAITNILLNIILIPLYADIGAIIASISSELIVTLLTFYYARKCLRIGLKPASCITTLSCSLLMGVVISFIMYWISNDIASLIVSICLGVSVYVTSMLVIKNEYMMDIMLIVKKNILRL